MKNILLIFILYYFGSIATTYSQELKYGNLTYPEAINMAGRQRMLTQRMSKAYVLQSNAKLEKVVNKELISSIAIFEKQLAVLTDNANNKNIKEKLDYLKELWEEYKSLLIIPENLKTANEILFKNSTLLDFCEEVVATIESDFESNTFITEEQYRSIRLVNKSGRQRMLSQRLCLYYLGVTMFNKNKNNYRLILKNVYKEFDTTIMNLVTYSGNTDQIRENLGTVLYHWEDFKTSPVQLFKGGFDALYIYDKTNELSNKFNIITSLYAAQALEKI